MKGRTASILALLSITAVTAAFADEPELPPPDEGDYIAYQAPKPPLHERVSDAAWFLRGWYLTGQAIYTFNNITGIETQLGPSPTIQKNISQNKFIPGIALGYTFRKSGIFSRMEINYQYRGNLNYDANPFLNFPGVTNQINSSISSNLILLKAYADFNLDAPITPYIQAGAGVAMNKTSGTATFDVFNSSFSNSQTNFAWDAGAGLRYALAAPLILDIGYEFDWLGKTKWDPQFVLPDPLAPVNIELESKTFYSNSIILGVTWIPIPKE